MDASIRRDLRALPNVVTMLRIVLLCVGATVYFAVSHSIGIVLCILAGVTDYLDGFLARRMRRVTRLGEILDQFCDLCFESFLITIATFKGFLAPYLIFIYLFREFWVACVRRFMAEAHMNIPSSWIGKAKSNLIMWSFLPTYLSIGNLVPSWEPYLGYAGRIMVTLGLVASYASALGYTRAFASGYAQAASKIE
jgi:CDP-diacylglycerol--glycerol-3-phosphate 3-phosphatidyltransferase